MDLKTLQKLLDHNSILMSKYYRSFADNNLKLNLPELVEVVSQVQSWPMVAHDVGICVTGPNRVLEAVEDRRCLTARWPVVV